MAHTFLRNCLHRGFEVYWAGYATAVADIVDGKRSLS
jgi:hypothetical protein